VVVNLGERVAVAAAAFPADPVALDDALEHLRGILSHPGQQCRAEVEAHPGIIVDQVDDSALAVH
jgi:hypothetical protein